LKSGFASRLLVLPSPRSGLRLRKRVSAPRLNSSLPSPHISCPRRRVLHGVESSSLLQIQFRCLSTIVVLSDVCWNGTRTYSLRVRESLSFSRHTTQTLARSSWSSFWPFLPKLEVRSRLVSLRYLDFFELFVPFQCSPPLLYDWAPEPLLKEPLFGSRSNPCDLTAQVLFLSNQINRSSFCSGHFPLSGPGFEIHPIFAWFILQSSPRSFPKQSSSVFPAYAYSTKSGRLSHSAHFLKLYCSCPARTVPPDASTFSLVYGTFCIAAPLLCRFVPGRPFRCFSSF